MIKAFILIIVSVFLVGCNNVESTLIRTKAGVVQITVSNEKYVGPEKDKPGSVVAGGTGFFIAENVILTNYHVIDNGNKITLATSSNPKEYQAELIMGNEKADIALIKISDWDEFKIDNPNIRILTLRNTLPNQGEIVYAMGHPNSLFYSLTKGIVSSPIRTLPSLAPFWFIQTDAGIYPGNSGGPMIDEYGDVVGMNTIELTQRGGSFGLAIPSVLILKFINDMELYGEIRWIRLGFEYDPRTLEIINVMEDSAALKAGLLTGDKIINVKTSTPINIKGQQGLAPGQLLSANLSSLNYETPIPIVVERKGQKINLIIEPKYVTF